MNSGRLFFVLEEFAPHSSKGQKGENYILDKRFAAHSSILGFLAVRIFQFFNLKNSNIRMLKMKAISVGVLYNLSPIMRTYKQVMIVACIHEMLLVTRSLQ